MRRGWMDWSPQEVPEALLRARVAQVADACRTRGIDVLVLYANFTRPAQVSALTHFVPFWSQSMLAVTQGGKTMLTMATTGRTVNWIRSSSVADEILVGADVGAVTGQWLAQKLQPARVAVAGMEHVPQSALDNLRRALPQADLLEAQDWYGALEAGYDPPAAVTRRAREIARGGLAQVTSQAHHNIHSVVAAVEGYCRAQGAEETSVFVAPDLAQGAGLQRVEGDSPFGQQLAVQVTVAYKGHWLRAGSSFRRVGKQLTELDACIQARPALQRAAAADGAPAELAAAMAQAAGATVDDWSLEARRAGLPLACLAASGAGVHPAALPAHATFSAQLRSGDERWLLIEPLAPA